MDGSLEFRGDDMFSRSRKELERIRGGQLALIPQNSVQSLTPTLRIRAQLTEALRLHRNLPEAVHLPKVIELLGQVRPPDPETIVSRYPHELSGGQQQRVAITMALAGEPESLLLNEPTTGLDVTTQAHILELMRDITSDRGMAMVYVSHNLGAIARICDRVVVMYAGEVVLEGSTRQVLTTPMHPYAGACWHRFPNSEIRDCPSHWMAGPQPRAAPVWAVHLWMAAPLRRTAALVNDPFWPHSQLVIWCAVTVHIW